MIEPHIGLLTKPENDALLYKVIPSRYLFDMLEKEYLYFRRVNTYSDDKDSAQPDQQQKLNMTVGFEKNPNFTLTDYYERCRSRTYACCFSTKISPYLWETYSNGDSNPICLVFKSALLINYINSVYEKSTIVYDSDTLSNFFHINYGLVEYGVFDTFIKTEGPHANPIEFAYFKDNKYRNDNEFRISLATHGIYKAFNLPDGTEFNFPVAIKLIMPLRHMLSTNVLNDIVFSRSCKIDFKKNFKSKLKDLGVNTLF